MSVIGKGRGRGFTDVQEAPLRRPGQLNVSKFSNLINLINEFFMKDPVFPNKIDKIVRMIEDSLKNNSLKEVFDGLHKQALEDRQFGVKLAIVCSDPKIYALSDCNVRLILLQALQKDYEEREQIKKRSVMQFRNAVSLLGGIYCNLKINGKPMDILSIPLLHYLQSLLDTSEEEDIELVTIQIFINGSKIFEQSSTGSEEFLISVRQTLVNRNLSAKSRAMLLFIIDLSNRCFRPLSGRIREFYFNKVNGNPFIEIENYISNTSARLVDDIFESCDFDKFKIKPDQNKVENIISITMKASQEKVDSGYVTTEKSLLNKNSEKPSVPRAIRGAGAGDSTKDKSNKKISRGKRGEITDGHIWSLKPSTSSKVWDHDDRFDKDYAQTC